MDAGEVRAHLNDRIREIFGGKVFEMVAFPGGPFDVPDDGRGRAPKLVVPSYDAVTIGAAVEGHPRAGGAHLLAQGLGRLGPAGAAQPPGLRGRGRCKDGGHAQAHAPTPRLAGDEEARASGGAGRAPAGQGARARARSEQELAITVQQCYRHVFYPSRHRLGTSGADLAHSAIDVHSASDRPGVGQRQVVRALRDLGKLRLPEDEPDSPAYVRDRTPLKKGQIATRALRDEFLARSGVAPSYRATTCSSGGAARHRTGRVRLPARGSAVRSRRSAGRDRDRRAVRGLHHGVRPEHGGLAASEAGGASAAHVRPPGAGRRRRQPFGRTVGGGPSPDPSPGIGGRLALGTGACLLHRRRLAQGSAAAALGAGPRRGRGPDRGC